MAALDNRQNIVMKQFTVIAGIFLPLSVVTGFFGMNFGWMVEEINSGDGVSAPRGRASARDPCGDPWLYRQSGAVPRVTRLLPVVGGSTCDNHGP